MRRNLKLVQYAAGVTLLLLGMQQAFGQKAGYLEEIRRAAEKGWNDNPAILSRWKQNTETNILWGYNPPAHPIYLAGTLAFLYGETGEDRYARQAAELLLAFGELRGALPKQYAATRVEYAEGIPSLTNFFFLPPYVRSYLLIRNSTAVDGKSKTIIEKQLAESADFVFRHPEWGAHNRAMLRAEALYDAFLALPEHPHAARWRQMAEVIASDNLKHWEIEDASNYNPIWFHALFSYAEAAKRPDVYTSAVVRYYLEYYTKLIGPNGTVPDFGDAGWNSASGGLRLVAVLEKGGAVFKDPEMKWAARSILNTVRSRAGVLGVGEAYHLADAYRWADEAVAPARPTSLSQEVLDDVIGKKVVFRDGWDSTSMYMLLNYRDEGEGGWLDREYLRQTLSVEEEKMTHGHADENSIVLLMNKGSVLLHDGGYRDSLPSGRYGAWRGDYFHNRVIARKDKKDKSQSLMEFVRNSGAYRAVRTEKIDFLNLHDVDMSRTRLTDDNLGYQWDRVVTYLKKPGWFVVVDGIKILRSDYFTFANLWHAQHILSRGDHFFDIVTDSVPGFQFSPKQSLMVYFPDTYAKTEGAEPLSRHWQQEQAIYQTISSQYKAGGYEIFVTVLVPHDRDVRPESLLPHFKPLKTSAPYRSYGLTFTRGGEVSSLCVKLDLEMEIARENIRPRYLYELGKVAYGDIETDAHFLYATIRGNDLWYSAANVLRVRYGGKTVMEALPNTHPLQLDGGPENHVGYSKWRYWEDKIDLTR